MLCEYPRDLTRCLPPCPRLPPFDTPAQIRRGETVLTIHERRMITSKSAAALDPGLGSQIAQALASYDPASAPTVGVMLAAVYGNHDIPNMMLGPVLTRF